MAEDHDILIARMSQLDSEVSEVTRDISALKSDVSGISTGLRDVALQVGQMMSRIDDWAGKQANAQKTNWAVIASFLSIAVALAIGVFTATAYFGKLSRMPLESDLHSLDRVLNRHMNQPGHPQSLVSLAKLEGRIMVLEYANKVDPKPVDIKFPTN